MKFLTQINSKNEIEFTPHIRHQLSKFDKTKKVTVEIKKLFNRRSLQQNKYFWLCMEILSDYTGHTAEEMHVIVKGLFCPKKHIKVGKISYSIPKGTSELTKGEFVELFLRIQAMAAELGCVLPSAEDYKRGLDEAKLLTD